MKVKNRLFASTLAVLVTSLILTGCGSKDGPAGKAEYLGFLGGQFTSMTSTVQSIQDKLSDFTEASLSDASWVSDMEKQLDQVDKACDAIVSYDKVPQDYTDLHSKLTSVANQLKPAVAAYKTGIENKDYDALSSANEQIKSTAASLQSYIPELKNLLGSQN
ncbi:DUF6376 family protein [Eubacterium sp. 1001713B170207_170306_E7]|uniref:DUF6376 family protein n=1 Tax=Eubacterium sp. 1001713B170207_170306_E7 TaxID=2787097 RepID=UPI00189BF13B|nr:DUF6376 family protein [Eubacterium sp. 1001713B170207_170306_E7]